MMVKALLKRQDGKEYGTKSVPEDCAALKWGGSIFARLGPESGKPTGSARIVYVRTDVFCFDDLDGANQGDRR